MIYIILFIIGAVIGSFLIATIYRMEKGESNVKGRSKCDHCEHSLSMLDTLPIVSWVVLSGKCRYCKKQISYKYTIFELFCGLMFVGVSWLGGFDTDNLTGIVELALWLVLLANLLALSVYDHRNKTIPDIFLITNAVFGVFIFALHGSESSLIYENWILGLVGAALLGLVFWGLHKYSKGRWLGEADMYLVTVFGLVLGPVIGLMSVFAASYIALIYVLMIKLLKTKKFKLTDQIAFGPFLSLGFVVSYFYGQQIIDLIK